MLIKIDNKKYLILVAHIGLRNYGTNSTILTHSYLISCAARINSGIPPIDNEQENELIPGES
jgi:hypothetical protein